MQEILPHIYAIFIFLSSRQFYLFIETYKKGWNIYT